MLYSSAFFLKLSLLIDATGFLVVVGKSVPEDQATKLSDWIKLLDVKQMLRAALCTMAEFIMLML